MRLLLAAAALALPMFPATAAAQEWIRVGGNDQLSAYVDATSIFPSNGKTVATTFSGYAKALGDTPIWFTAVKIEYNCKANQFRTLEYTYYDKAGNSLGTEASFTINETRTVTPGSIDETFFKYACTKQGGVPVQNPFTDSRTRLSN
ncbi:hypothetical protein P1X14_08455 [Sphingomonas sp. AOB5]|uniref:surface-adhesin E family protein n=1 Tax=Sphingomonas sp. AOB5 TaxID=3034017 RepID=UPI0023F7EE83|nr:surface-adhesin E family protein [Sphingomonas sp. AOB5]MDF7775275.1 hypothetical protein [Sphingomonas sp. AOB5]